MNSGQINTKSSNETLSELLYQFVNSIKEKLNADIVSFFVYDDSTDTFHLPIGVGLYDEDSFRDEKMLPRSDRGMAKYVLEKESLFISSIKNDPELNAAFAHRERIQSGAGLTCQYQKKTVGIVFVSFRQVHEFSEHEKNLLKNYTSEIATTIVESQILENLSKPTNETPSMQEKTLQSIVELVCAFTHFPVSVWLSDGKQPEHWRIQAASGLPKNYQEQACCLKEVDCLISRVLVTGKMQVIEDVQQDPQFAYKEHAKKSGWVSAFGFPIFRRGQVIGAIESFTFDPLKLDKGVITNYKGLADLVGVSLDNIHRPGQIEQLVLRIGALANEMSASPGLESILQSIVDAALELTGANSSSIFLYSHTDHCFINGFSSPKTEGSVKLPKEDGLTYSIVKETYKVIKERKVVHIRNYGKDKLAEKQHKEEIAQSLIGVALDIDEEKTAVLYVRGNYPNQFTEAHEILLATLGAQAYLALGLGRFLLDSINEVERAAVCRFDKDTCLDQMCDDTMSFGFKFAAVQLISKEEQIIETVYTKGLPKNNWAGLAKHSLENEEKVSDIQADLAKANPPMLKIISGYYEKFDRWIYEEFKHAQFTRAWVPIILVRDKDGKVVDDWFTTWFCEYEPQSKAPNVLCINLILPHEYLKVGYKAEIIGTLEVGFCDELVNEQALKSQIIRDKVIELTKLAAHWALKLHKTLLPYVLEVIANKARQIIHADSASLHFFYNPERNKFSYQVCAGELGLSFLKDNPPRTGGLGQKAIHENKVKFIPDPSQNHSDNELEISNPQLWSVGVRAMAAFPLTVGEEAGVLYVLFRKQHRFTDNEIAWVELFAKRAEEVIRNSIDYNHSHDNTQVLSTLHDISWQIASKPQDENLLRKIAGNTMNIMASDVTNIYEYDDGKQHFLLSYAQAGRLYEEDRTLFELEEHSAPQLFLKSEKDYYDTENAIDDEIMNSCDRVWQNRGVKPFVVREKIKSSAAIALKVEEETVGVMFVSFRRKHIFTDWEKKIIKTLALNAAIAIKNRRLFDIIKASSQEILGASDISGLLNIVVRHAKEITGADVSDIRLKRGVDDLYMRARYPETEAIDVRWNSIKIGEAIIGKVAKNKVSRIIYDTRNENDYTPYFSDLRSKIHAPLLAGNGEVLGVLSVGSRKHSKFNERDRMLLETLINQTVIAYQNIQRQERIAASEAMITLGDISGNIIHRMKNDIGLIRQYVLMLNDSTDGQDEVVVKNVIDLTDEIFLYAQQINESIPKSNIGINISEVLNEAFTIIKFSESVKISCQYSDSMPLVKGGESQLLSLFLNLLQNASDEMPNKGLLTVNAHYDNQWVKINIADSGKGMTEEQLDNLFKRRQTNKRNGLGFGLWWNKIYIERLGGDIYPERESGIGSSFTVLLPIFKKSSDDYKP